MISSTYLEVNLTFSELKYLDCAIMELILNFQHISDRRLLIYYNVIKKNTNGCISKIPIANKQRIKVVRSFMMINFRHIIQLYYAQRFPLSYALFRWVFSIKNLKVSICYHYQYCIYLYLLIPQYSNKSTNQPIVTNLIFQIFFFLIHCLRKVKI